MSKNEIYIINDNNAFLPGSGTAVTTFREGEADTGFLEDRKFTAKRIAPASGSCTRGEVEFVPFGPDDDTPLKVMERIHKNTIVGSNIDFKVNMAFGDGLAVYRSGERPDWWSSYRRISRMCSASWSDRTTTD